MAANTMQKPAENASSASSFCRPASTWPPTSPVPICEAITTMPNAIMITWLRPSRTVRRANGSCTLRSSCGPVDPNDRPTSVDTIGTSRNPWLVSRTAGATAKINVATTAAGTPIPKNATHGMRYT